MRETCPRCGSDKIIPNVPLLNRYGELGGLLDTAEVQVHGTPEAWVFKDTATGKVSLRICGACGHAELRVSNFGELYENYQKTREKPISEEATCLSCGKRIPEEATACPACGWTWGAEPVTPADRPRD